MREVRFRKGFMKFAPFVVGSVRIRLKPEPFVMELMVEGGRVDS